MRKISFLVLAIFSFCTLNALDTIPASHAMIEYTGRIDFANPNVPRFSYSGVSIRASFTGTSIALVMDDDIGRNIYNVILDGRMLDTLGITRGKRTYEIASDLEDTSHEIEVFKRTEEMFGKTEFFGFVIDDGADLVELENERVKLIEYIGNSITCGYGNEGVLGGSFGPTTQNHYMSFATINSRNFNARHLAVSRSGIGIYRNYNGPVEVVNNDCMTDNYTRIFLYDENPEYSFSETPDLVCINLGTNDFSTTGGDSALYVSNYFRLIDTIQAKYSMPEIICLLGPMISDPVLTRIRSYLTFIADSADRKGKGNVHFFEMSAQTGSEGIGIDYHPTVDQHIKNGMELSDFIHSIKAWKLEPLVIKASLDQSRHLQLEFNTAVIDSAGNFEGFEVFVEDEKYAIDTVYRDPAQHKNIHLVLGRDVRKNANINLNYIPGRIYSEDSVKMKPINYFKVKNNSSYTGISTPDQQEAFISKSK